MDRACLFRARTERVQRITCTDVEIATRNRRCGPNLFIQIVHGEDFPLRVSFKHSHFAARTYEKDLAIRRDRRCVVLLERIGRATLFQNLSARRIETGNNPALFHQIHHAAVDQRRRYAWVRFLDAPNNVRRRKVALTC